ARQPRAGSRGGRRVPPYGRRRGGSHHRRPRGVGRRAAAPLHSSRGFLRATGAGDGPRAGRGTGRHRACAGRGRRTPHGEPVSERPRSLLVCPGIGSYGPGSLGSLPADHPAVQAAEHIRIEYGLEPLVSLDAAAQFDPSRHLRPANAAALTFMATLLEAERAMADHRLVAIAGTSLVWFSALGIAAALPFEDAFRLMQE